ncbi:MAG: lactonase family protein [Bacteroidetes bacterium]|nr:lactonase family protein [Fibrella sp.]
MKSLVTVIACSLVLLSFDMRAQIVKEILYVGTYSVRGSEGLYVYEFDRAKGTFERIQTASELKSPSFIAIHPSGKYLYAVSEAGQGSGSVGAYAIDPKTGKLTFLNQQLSHGNGPCYVNVDQTGKWAFVANYGGGSMAVLPIQPNGSLGAATDSVRYSGSGPNAQRQEKPHAHSVTISPDNKFVYVADLGTDRVYIYALDVANGTVKPATTPFVSVKPGAGPRHLTFDPSGKRVYVAEELISSTAAFAYDAKTGALTLIEDAVSSLPADFTGNNTSADIHPSPNGKFLYQSNRGYHALAIFSVANSGKLTLVGQQPTQGKTPRNFMVDARGNYVLAANQDTDNVVMFTLDAKTGKLTPKGTELKIPAPVCLQLLELK